jgi:hypothetical protein
MLTGTASNSLVCSHDSMSFTTARWSSIEVAFRSRTGSPSSFSSTSRSRCQPLQIEFPVCIVTRVTAT